MTDTITRIMKTIGGCTDPKKLRQIAINAREKGELVVARAADLRMYAILPSEAPGTLEFDVWQSIHALEGTLTNERGRPHGSRAHAKRSRTLASSPPCEIWS